MNMHVDDQFKDIIQAKYEEAKKNNLTSIILNEEKIGGLTLFINEKPAVPMLTFEASDDKLYVGATEIIPTS